MTLNNINLANKVSQFDMPVAKFCYAIFGGSKRTIVPNKPDNFMKDCDQKDNLKRDYVVPKKNAPEKFRLICLNDNIPTLMAVANDISFDNVFYHQLLGRLRKEDLIIAISGSGNSKNVIKAVEYAREIGTKIIGISGYDGGKLYKLSDYHLHAPISHMQVVEDVHMSFDHMIMTIFYEYFSSKTNN